jgi:hypothetical protein
MLHAKEEGTTCAMLARSPHRRCRLVGVDPAAYLTDVLPRLARRIRIADLAALMPKRWKTGRLSTASQPAAGAPEATTPADAPN